MSFLSVTDKTPGQLADLVELGLDVKRNPERYRTALAHKSVGLFFAKQSLRTQVSCDIACAELGAHSLIISNDQTGLGTRESPEDVGRVLDRYVDLLGMRVYSHSVLEAVGASMDTPVVNLLSDREHPCQAVADLMTVAEHRPLAGATVAFVGDGNNVCHSLMLAVTMTGGSFRAVAPAGYEPSEEFIAMASAHGPVLVTNNVKQALEGADAVYTDVWTSMGQEAEKAERLRQFEDYRVDEALFALAAPDAIFMHCLPAHRGEEVTDGVMDHPRSRVFDQAENRLHSFKAVLLDQLG